MRANTYSDGKLQKHGLWGGSEMSNNGLRFIRLLEVLDVLICEFYMDRSYNIIQRMSVDSPNYKY
jgi:hypothetical protein